MGAPLARYRNNVVAFIHDLTPLRLDPTEQRIVREFEGGYRSGLGLRFWNAESLCRSLYVTYAVIAWRTLCFEHQLTGVYAKSQKRALPWINGFSIFVNRCDPLISAHLQFAPDGPRVTVPGDDYWRVLVFNPNESELEHAKNWLTNVVYFDFDRIPEWLIRETQHALHRENSTQSCTLALVRTKPKFNKVAPPPYEDGSCNSDD